ncbi:uncharacterized protein NECHADRAFT_47422, partial [Fusarium vanettenii 77-13-4]
RPLIPLGHPHSTSEDINYEGYRIPKGAGLHLNAFAVGHQEKRNHNPEMFNVMGRIQPHPSRA